MAELRRGELPQTGNATEAENQPPVADLAREMAEARLNQALDQLDQQPECQAYNRATEELEGAKMDYDNAWTAFLHTHEGRHYNESNQRYQNAKKHHDRTKEKVAPNEHFKNHAAAESHRANSAEMVARANEQANIDPEFERTAEYRQIGEHHQGILARCRQAWKDIGYTLEGKDYHRAKIQIDQAEREVSLAWARGSQIPEGQKLNRIMDQVDQLEQKYQQAEQAYKQTPAYEEYTQAAEDYRLATFVADQNKNSKKKLATIIPIEDDATRDGASPGPKILAAG